MVSSDCIRGVLVLALVFVHNIWAIYAILFAMSVVSTFFVPAQSVAIRTIATTAGLFALRCFGALLSVYVRDVLLSNSAAFGILNTLIGIGMIIGTQLLTRFARHIPQQNLVIYGLGGMGVAVFVTALLGSMAGTAAGMLGLGFCAAAIFVTATTLLQHETPQELLGRVMSCLMSLMAGSQVLAMFVAAPVAEKAGIRNLYYGSAAMLLAIGAIGYYKLPARAARAASEAD